MLQMLFYPLLCWSLFISITSAQTVRLEDRMYRPFHDDFKNYLDKSREKLQAEYQQKFWQHQKETGAFLEYDDFLLQKASAPDKEGIFHFVNVYSGKSLLTKEKLLKYIRKNLPESFGIVENPAPFFVKLEELLILIETYQNAGVKITKNFDKKLQFEPQGLKIEVPTPDFNKLIEEKLGKTPELKEVQEFFHWLLEDEEILEQAPYYLHTDLGDCTVKKSNLLHFFNDVSSAVLGKKIKLITIEGIAKDGVYSRDYRSMPQEYRNEMLFKFLAIMEKVQQLRASLEPSKKFSDEDKKELITFLMHAGRHCPDARKQVTNEILFPKFCRDLNRELEEMGQLTARGKMPTGDEYNLVRAYFIAAKLKKEALLTYLNEIFKHPPASDAGAAAPAVGPKKGSTDAEVFAAVTAKDDIELTTRRASTWDVLAPDIGIPKFNSGYGSSWANSKARPAGILTFYTPVMLLTNYINDKASTRYLSALGELGPFQGPDFIKTWAVGELLRFGLIKIEEPASATELEVLKNYPELQRLVSPLATGKEQKTLHANLVLHGILRGDGALVKKYLDEDVVSEEIKFLNKYGPYRESGVPRGEQMNLWEFIQNYWTEKNGASLEKSAGVRLVVKMLKELLDAGIIEIEEDGNSLVEEVINANNNLLFKVLMQEGIPLSANSRKILIRTVNARKLQLIEKNKDLITDGEQLLQDMQHALELAPASSKGGDFSENEDSFSVISASDSPESATPSTLEQTSDSSYDSDDSETEVYAPVYIDTGLANLTAEDPEYRAPLAAPRAPANSPAGSAFSFGPVYSGPPIGLADYVLDSDLDSDQEFDQDSEHESE